MSREAGGDVRTRSASVSVTLVLLAGLTGMALPASGNEPLVLVSVAEDGALGDGPSGTYGVSVSEDGSVVAFSSVATSLLPDDVDAEVDVYVRDLKTGRLRLASTSSSGKKASTFSLRPSLDATGGSLAFLSAADDLHPDDTDGYTDVFVKDLASGELSLASTDALGTKAAANSGPPDLSADGQRVAFTSQGALVAADTDTAPDVYVKDLETGALHLASRRVDGSGAATGYYGTGLPSLSADGTTVAFDTDAGLDPRDTDGAPDVYVKNLTTGALLLASVTANGMNSLGGSFRPSLSADGQTVAFDSTSDDLAAEDPAVDSDVYVKDLMTGAVTVASKVGAPGPSSEGRSTDASLSADATTVAFSSQGAGLGPEDDGTVLSTWVKDLATGRFVLASSTPGGQPADALSISPRLSGDGTTVVFTTPATDLVPTDDNGWADVYLRRLSAAVPPIDDRAPVLDLQATPELLRTRALTPVTITGSVTDAGSGVASVRFLVEDEYGEVQPLVEPIDASGAATSEWSRTVLLPGRARPHDQDGRDFSISATATDVAGNAVSTHVHVRTTPWRERLASARHGRRLLKVWAQGQRAHEAGPRGRGRTAATVAGDGGRTT